MIDTHQSPTPNIAWIDGVILIITLIVLTYGIGQYALFEPHEGHFAGVAREMLLRNDWVTPTLNGSPYLNKPPLFYWLIALSTKVFGFNEYAARLPLAIASWWGVFIGWKWARELWNPAAGRYGALMLSATCGWFVFTHQLLIDLLLSTILLTFHYCLWRWIWQTRHQGYWFAIYLLLGLCILTKGPFMMIYPIASIAGLVISRRSFHILHQLRLLSGSAITLSVLLPWVIAIERANPGFLQYFLFNENLKRIADTRWPPDYTISQVNPWAYLAIAAVWCLPWTLVLPQAIYSAWKDQLSHPPTSQSDGRLILATAAITPLLVFLPVPSRLLYYSLPCVAPLILFCARWWSFIIREPLWERKLAGILFCLLGGILGCISLGVILWGTEFPELMSIPQGSFFASAIAFFMGLGLICGGSLLLLLRPRFALISICLGTFSAYIILVHGFGAIQDFRSGRTLVETANSRLDRTTLWTFEGSRELGTAGAMSYYLDRQGTKGDSLQVGWVSGKSGTQYRIIMVLEDGGNNRIPPIFPGERPSYALTKAELQEYWDSDRPVVFITDFLRQANDPNDPVTLNLPQNAGEALLVVSSRELYGNLAAHALWHQF